MRTLEKELEFKTFDFSKLIGAGFVMFGENFVFKKKIFEGQFEMIVNVSKESQTSVLVDVETNDEFSLVDVKSAVGEFVGRVRQVYENELKELIKKCSYNEVFKANQSKEVISYIKEKYGDELEFLWSDSPKTAIWRNKQNEKWYGILMTISERKLGIDSDKVTEVIDLRYQKDETGKVVDLINIFPGYHMNKNSWITIKMDESVNTQKIFNLIDNSYELSLRKKVK